MGFCVYLFQIQSLYKVERTLDSSRIRLNKELSEEERRVVR